jgi:hypothetical protein
MSRVVLLVGTRKGLFILESEDRKSWSTRGPYCESWPVYHAIYDGESDTIFVGAGSEWHGAAVWRSKDVGETWEWSGEGLKREEGEFPITKVASVTAAHGRLLAGVGYPGSSRATTAAPRGHTSPTSRPSPRMRSSRTRRTRRRASSA